MNLLTVGQAYPIAPANEGFAARIEGASFNIVGFAGGVRAAEVRQFKSNPLRYGLYVHPGEPRVPFFMVDIAGSEWQFDVSINLKNEPRDRQQGFLDDPGNLVVLTLCNYPDGIIRGIRALGVQPDIMREIKQICTEQVERATAGQIDAAITACYGIVSLNEMLAQTEMTLAGRR